MNITNELKDKYQSLIDKGYTSYQIASEIGVSASTVKRNLIILNMKTIHKVEPIIISLDALKELIEKKYTIRKIAKELNRSQGSIKHRLKKYKLKTHSDWCRVRKEQRREIVNGYKTCPKCHEKFSLIPENFYIKKSGKFHCWCKKCNDTITYQKQTERKKLCVEYKGGKCSICGYNRYIGSLDFHHVDPTKKEFNISRLRTYTWDILKLELDKCICVCKNCHGEIHGKLKMVGRAGIEPATNFL